MTAVEHIARREAHALYEAHHGWLQAWLRRRLCDAADLAHDAFLRVIALRRSSWQAAGARSRALPP